ncbi:MAG: hypothetical protein RIR90_1570, partial [Bacteroidota bacterium]
ALCNKQLNSDPSRKHLYRYAIERIEKPKEIQLPQHRELPPGAPIGCEF